MSRIIMHRKLEHQLKYQTYQLILSTFYFTALHGLTSPAISVHGVFSLAEFYSNTPQNRESNVSIKQK